MSRSDVPAEPAMEMSGHERPSRETDARSALFETFSRFSEAFDDASDEELEREIAKAQAEVRAERRGERERMIAEAGVDREGGG